jgi:transcriptional regulator with XRE-family HTH domain
LPCSESVRMTENSFGDVLTRFHARASDGRSSDDWLAFRVGVDRSEVSRWKSGRRGPPERRVVIRIAELLSLSADEADELLDAARRSRSGRRTGEAFEPLSEEERRAWRPIFGPSHLAAWREQLGQARCWNIYGEMQAAADIATSMLRQLDAALSPAGQSLYRWSEDELRETRELWLRAAAELFHPLAAIMPSIELGKHTRPYVRRARMLARDLKGGRWASLAEYLRAERYNALARLQPWRRRLVLVSARRARDGASA